MPTSRVQSHAPALLGGPVERKVWDSASADKLGAETDRDSLLR